MSTRRTPAGVFARPRCLWIIGLAAFIIIAAVPPQSAAQAPAAGITQIGVALLDRHASAATRVPGVRAVKILADWSAIEADRGRLTWADLDRAVAAAEEASMQAVLVLAHTPRWASIGVGTDLLRAEIYSRQPPRDVRDWERFVAAAADRYRGRVRDWQIWTQLGLPFFRGTGSEYLALLRAARARIKAADAQARVAMAAPVGMDVLFLTRVLAGAPEAFDVVALSPHGLAPEALLRPLSILAARLRASAKTLWIDWSADPATPGDRAVAQWNRLHAIAQASGVERLFAPDVARYEASLRSMGALLAARPFAGYLAREPDVYMLVFGTGGEAALLAWARAEGRAFEVPSEARVSAPDGQAVAPEAREGKSFARLTEMPVVISPIPAALVADARATAAARGPLLPVVGPERDFGRAQEVSARLGRTGEEKGLYNLPYRARRNGAVEPIDIDGGEAVRTSVGRDVIYVYFDVDDTFLYFVEGRAPVEITVEVLGARAPRQLGFNLLYDSTGGYRFTPWQWVDAKDGWVTYTIRLTDANFSNTWGFDFAINAAGNRAEDLTVRSVIVRKASP